MSDNKLSPEKLKQLQALQALLASKQQGGGAPGAGGMPFSGTGEPIQSKKFSLPTPKSMMIAILNSMQSSVKFIDQFTDFIVKKDSTKVNDVIKSARSPILFGTYVIIMFVICGFLWAATAPLDSATVAVGTLISSSKKRDLNHPEGGIIKKIYVSVGDKVKTGDPLIEFDDTRTKTEHEITLNQYRTLLATENRLNAELNDEDHVNYNEELIRDKDLPQVAKIIETQDSLFKSRREIKIAEKESLKQKKNQMQKQIEGLNAKKVATQKSLDVAQDRLDAAQKLFKQGLAQKTTVLQLEERESAAESEIANADTDIARSEQEITKTDIELLNVDSKFSTQALSELKETQVNLAQSKERLYYLSDALSRIIVKSPVDGIVNNLNYYTIGASVQPYQPLVEISPLDDHLVIEAKVEPKNIDSIRVGLVAKIRFSAFKSRTTPLFEGKVISLSPDLVIDRNHMGGDPRLAAGYYLAKIELDMDKFNEVAKTRALELHPGMQAEVQIVTGTRTLLRYLLDPVIDAMFKGFKEK